ncbi:cupin domain-containing protein [Virgibacillus sp. MSJ-26]|uniref:cupin domain-containing protein n=1 Tax=Virgibacillus sp. MSJ-26 TaxID=2841522 RepID=UPI001C10CCE2|nr:cupin domain-containing protein [Virgibacillus sp. MSJ-26]MBU5466169.1 cupin domain-containing protein [Virgibacillus sp. MSJ-26]
MEFYKFSKEVGTNVSKFNSNFIMSRLIQTNQPTNIGCVHLEEHGNVGYHQAETPQLLLVVDGEGCVRREKGEYFKIHPGEAVFWEKDEWHETKSDKGLTAIVIEGVELDPSEFMSKIL